jgi:hypothetical protein
LDGHKNAAASSYSECNENVCARICSLIFVSFFKNVVWSLRAKKNTKIKLKNFSKTL